VWTGGHDHAICGFIGEEVVDPVRDASSSADRALPRHTGSNRIALGLADHLAHAAWSVVGCEARHGSEQPEWNAVPSSWLARAEGTSLL
jgi:hypothetical protein